MRIHRHTFIGPDVSSRVLDTEQSEDIVTIVSRNTEDFEVIELQLDAEYASQLRDELNDFLDSPTHEETARINEELERMSGPEPSYISVGEYSMPTPFSTPRVFTSNAGSGANTTEL